VNSITEEEEIKNKIYFVNNSKNEIEKANTLSDVYNIIDKLNECVSFFYPQISCNDKCFLCCQHSNVPIATSLEWEYIYNHLSKLPKEQQKDLIDANNKLFSKHGLDLKRLHFTLNLADNEFKLKVLAVLLPKFLGTSCLFLKNGSCSIYDVRPSKCRTQGYSLVNFGKYTQFQTCVPEANRLEKFLKEQGTRKVLMPFSNDIEEKIQSLILDDNIWISILPVWLYTHTNNNELVSKINLSPEFEEILSIFQPTN